MKTLTITIKLTAPYEDRKFLAEAVEGICEDYGVDSVTTSEDY